MQKFALVLICLFSAFAWAGKGTLTCTSSDFNPKNYDGQGLRITFDAADNVTKIEKMHGSWFCDDKIVMNPDVLATRGDFTIYEVNFGCDEWNGRLALHANPKDHQNSYSFTWADDERNRRTTSILSCE